jgi:hypothetical protein
MNDFAYGKCGDGKGDWPTLAGAIITEDAPPFVVFEMSRPALIED